MSVLGTFHLDVEDPVIMCPADIVQSTDSGRPTARVTIPDATRSDNSRTPLTTTTHPYGSPLALGIGNHTVTYTVSDVSRNSASCNLTITVRGKMYCNKQHPPLPSLYILRNVNGTNTASFSVMHGKV